MFKNKEEFKFEFSRRIIESYGEQLKITYYRKVLVLKQWFVIMLQ